MWASRAKFATGRSSKRKSPSTRTIPKATKDPSRAVVITRRQFEPEPSSSGKPNMIPAPTSPTTFARAGSDEVTQRSTATKAAALHSYDEADFQAAVRITAIERAKAGKRGTIYHGILVGMIEQIT